MTYLTFNRRVVCLSTKIFTCFRDFMMSTGSTGVKIHQVAKVEGRKSNFERALARTVGPLQKLRANLETKPEGLGLLQGHL